MGGATGVDPNATDFEWTSPQAAAFNMNLRCGPSTQPTYDVDVFTMQPTARIPDTKALGLAFPSGASYEWFAYSFTGIDKADLLVGPAGWRQYAVAYRAASDGWYTRSGTRTFTTK